ncbi:MAG: BON domain-containing protein [Anaerolineales bacterium]|nr:BON domain-containing protein [Anaerolineales bacterium]
MAHKPIQTTDEKLRAAILSRFAADERTAFANLRVGVLNGLVHLAGVAATIEIRIAAAELAESLPGVRGVINRIESPGAPSPSRTINLELSPTTNMETKKGVSDENCKDL